MKKSFLPKTSQTVTEFAPYLKIEIKTHQQTTTTTIPKKQSNNACYLTT